MAHLKPVIWILGGVGAVLILKRAAPGSPLGAIAAKLSPALNAIPIGGAGQLLGATSARPPAVGPAATNLATRYGTATSPLAPGLKTNAPLPPGLGTQVGLATGGIGSLFSGLANLFKPSTAPKPLTLPPASAPPAQAKPSAPGGNTSAGGGSSAPNISPSRPPSAVGYDINGNLTSDPNKVYQNLNGQVLNLADAGYVGFDINGNPTFDASKVYQDLSGNVVDLAAAGYAGYDINGNATFDASQVAQTLDGVLTNPADAGYAGYDVSGNLTFDPSQVYQDFSGNVQNYADAGYAGYDINGNPTYDPSLVYQDLSGTVLGSADILGADPALYDPQIVSNPYTPDQSTQLDVSQLPTDTGYGYSPYDPTADYAGYEPIDLTNFPDVGEYYTVGG